MQNDEDEDEDEINATRPCIEHTYKRETGEGYAKEIVIAGVNKSIYLKTNEVNVSIKNMLEWGQKALNDLDKGGG